MIVLGATIALNFTSVDVKNQEETQTKDFLDVVYTELLTKSEFVYNMAEELEREDADIEAICSTMKIMPISPVLSLDVLLSDSPYTSTISSFAYSALLSCRMNFIMQQKRIEEHTDKEEIKKDLMIMSNELERAYKIIEIELKYQNGRISKEEVYNKINVLMFTPVVDEKYG